MNSKCNFCDCETEDGAGLVIERTIKDKEKPVRLHWMSIYCCYTCFYGKLCKTMDQIGHRFTSELIEKSKENR